MTKPSCECWDHYVEQDHFGVPGAVPMTVYDDYWHGTDRWGEDVVIWNPDDTECPFCGKKAEEVKSLTREVVNMTTAEWRREYQRKYYQAHKEKAKAYQRHYNLTHKKTKKRSGRRVNNHHRVSFDCPREPYPTYNQSKLMALPVEKFLRACNQIRSGERMFTV